MRADRATLPGSNRGADRGCGLLAWSDRNRRDLPWRRTRDPWAILVSEVMLQQTRVERVVPAYRGFLDRFPEPAACAGAPLGAVLDAWAGLGYPRRARALHSSAATITEGHAGAVPDDLDALLALPGVGPYTARAVLAFAFERDVGVVDTNAARVLARWSGRGLAAKEAQAVADEMVPAGEGWAWNQAVLDLGATVCRPRTPDCGACPATGRCAWFRTGAAGPDPAARTFGTGSSQPPFEGSDRQGRGRLMAALRGGATVRRSELAAVMGWPDDPDRVSRVTSTLVADGLVVEEHDRFRTP